MYEMEEEASIKLGTIGSYLVATGILIVCLIFFELIVINRYTVFPPERIFFNEEEDGEVYDPDKNVDKNTKKKGKLVKEGDKNFVFQRTNKKEIDMIKDDDSIALKKEASFMEEENKTDLEVKSIIEIKEESHDMFKVNKDKEHYHSYNQNKNQYNYTKDKDHYNTYNNKGNLDVFKEKEDYNNSKEEDSFMIKNNADQTYDSVNMSRNEIGDDSFAINKVKKIDHLNIKIGNNTTTIAAKNIDIKTIIPEKTIIVETNESNLTEKKSLKPIVEMTEKDTSEAEKRASLVDSLEISSNKFNGKIFNHQNDIQSKNNTYKDDDNIQDFTPNNIITPKNVDFDDNQEFDKKQSPILVDNALSKQRTLMQNTNEKKPHAHKHKKIIHDNNEEIISITPYNKPSIPKPKKNNQNDHQKTTPNQNEIKEEDASEYEEWEEEVEYESEEYTDEEVEVEEADGTEVDIKTENNKFILNELKNEDNEN